MGISLRTACFGWTLLFFSIGCAVTSLHAMTQSLKNKSLEELAELFSLYPQGIGFQLSPEGDRFYARVSRKGETGLVVVDLDELGDGIEKGLFVAPNQSYELSQPGWVDNDFVGYNVKAGNGGLAGFQVVSCKKEGNLLQYRDSGDFDVYTRIEYSTPGLMRRFFVEEQLWRDIGKKEPSIVLLELDKGLKLKEVTRWTNPGFIEDWYFIRDEPYAVSFDRKTYKLDFDLLRDVEHPDEEKVRASLVPLELPGKIKYLKDKNTALMYLKSEDGYTGMTWYNPDEVKPIGEPIFLNGYDFLPLTIELRAGGPLAGLLYYKDKPKALYFDPELGKLMKHLEETVQQGYPVFRGLSKDNRYIFYMILTDNQGTIMARFDLKTGENQPIYHTRPWLQDMDLPSLNPVTYPNRNGDLIHGYLMLPEDFRSGNPVPLVAMPNDYYGSREQWGFDSFAQFLASLGYAVLQVNYRGSGGYGDAYALDGDFLGICQESPNDVIDGIKWAVDQGYVDARRVALFGEDYGANVSLSCLALEPEIATCVIGNSGFYDYAEVLEKGSFVSDTSDEKLVQDAEEKFQQVKALSPIHYSEKIKVPVLLFHEDYRQSAAPAKAMQEALEASGTHVELVEFEAFDKESDWSEYYEKIGAFLLKHLGQ
ncbi:MAG: alpha/beta hydrolase family protein [Puniceicoccaceae bacterium]